MSRPGAPRTTSLLSRLFGRMGLLFLVIVMSVGLAAFLIAQHRINKIYDGQLIIGANVLRALMSDELKEATSRGGGELQVDDSLLSDEDRQAFDNYAEWRMFRVWLGPRLVLRSDTGPAVSRPQPDGFHDIHAGDKTWRIYTLSVPARDVRVEVGERTDIRLVLVRGIAVGLVIPLLLLAPTAALLIWLALNDGLQTLRVLLAEIGRRSMRDLSPLALDPWPRDLHPLVRSINRLFERIDRALRQERQFLDDAAHQLRTPLAAVKLQAQMIAREADPRERELLTAQLGASVDRASAMTNSLLTLARLDAQTAAGEGGDLRRETVAAMADLAPLANRRDVGFAFEGGGDMPAGDPLLLRLVAANLIENAVNHAPAGSEVTVRLSTSAGGHRLTVIDGGPGIAPAERERVVQRFHRGEQAAPAGSGLGLSIVVEALRLLDGKLSLLNRDDGASGLKAVVEFPNRGAEIA